MKIISLRTIITIYCCIITLHTIHATEPIPSKKHKTGGPLATYNNGISDGEKMFLKNRLPIVKAALEKMLNRSLSEKQVPKIAMIGSGGGYRAMFCTTGSLCGAQKIGLLDASTYITALSGSTWAIAPLIATGQSIDNFKNYLKDCASKPFTEFTFAEEELVLKAIIKKINKRPFTPVDPYDFCLANRLLTDLKEKRHTVTLSEQTAKIEQGSYPYPIFVAIDGRETIVTGQTWFDFTVHTIRDHNNNIHIPTESYGSTFEEGKLHKQAHEKSLGYDMGTWGSAFGANFHEILKEVIKDPNIRKEIESKVPQSIEGERPLHFYAEVPNYLYKMKDIKDTTLCTEKYLKFVDAGLEINLPYPPVSGICPERKPDILIFLDASAGPVGEQLQNVVDYAQKHNLPFPVINFKNIDKKTISIFKDENNKEVPVVIYMPRISDTDLWEKHKLNQEYAEYNLSKFDLHHETNEGFCKTQKFQYTPEHSTLVMNQTEFNMHVNKDAIIKEINWCIDRK